ncbi:hypothetical protein EZJ43_00655 [Pedobacter changchengzhani]|uniref:Uncharacterized protein n=2 Tax=Pedobacter changchengzhani TaxID=2529274 RepID=A0A4R5MQS6_9SPHI|nr:hypothetical protein EZJ43_00655 [Pedobacter changchengzhani]
MMKNLLKPIAVFIVLTALFTSCRKDDKLIDNTNSFDALMAKYKIKGQVFTINGATGGTIIGTGGSKITFPANALVNGDGSPFSGDATITIKEALKKSDWLTEGLSATTVNNILVSGGMLDIKVQRKDNGANLLPAPIMREPNQDPKAVIMGEVIKPRVKQQDLQLFLPDNTTSTPATDPPSAWTSASYYPFGNGTNSYIFQIPQFRWVNCDGLYNQPGVKTTIKVTPDLSAFAGASNIQAILVYRDINTVITLPPSPGFFQSYSNSIAEGSIADVICIGKTADGKILFKVMPAVTFTTNMNIAITPQVANATDVSAYLDSINN